MQSFLDTDSYSFGVGQAIFEHFPNVVATYEFIDRNQTVVKNPLDFLAKLDYEIDKIASIHTTPEEIRYLESQGHLKWDYLFFLLKYRFNRKDVHTYIDEYGRVRIVVKGLWRDTIFWEVPLLSAVTQLYLEDSPLNMAKHYDSLKVKRGQMAGLNYCEFGTRRRRDYRYQYIAVEVLKEAGGFIGTSNSHLARLFNIKNVGTQSHQYIMGCGAIAGVKNANRFAMERWVETYQGKLGVALTDTYTTDVFLRDFNGVYSRLMDGVRQDSGDPVEYADKIHKHYASLGINPSYKTVYFSNGLNPESSHAIDREVQSTINRTYCIGTDFTNDQKLNVVMKLTKLDDVDLCKLSDDPGKSTGKAEVVQSVKKELCIA